MLKKIGTAVALAGAMSVASAGPFNLVKNGGFESTSGIGQIGGNVTLSDWSSVYLGYNFVMAEGTGDSQGAQSVWYANPLTLWGLNSALPGEKALEVSNNRGNFVAADGAYGVEALTQLITGLVVGHTYEVSFEWAAAQQFGFTGSTTEQWTVSLGEESHSTAAFHNASHSSSSWMQETFRFTANAASELLSFLAAGTPSGEPPFSLLDGVSMYDVTDSQVTTPTDIPEPASLAMMAGGLGLMAFLARRRKKAA